MSECTIATVSCLFGATFLAVAGWAKRMGWVKGNARTSDFETGVAAGLAIAGALNLLAPLVADLPF